jgi:hypothetical protein
VLVRNCYGPLEGWRGKHINCNDVVYLGDDQKQFRTVAVVAKYIDDSCVINPQTDLQNA